MSVRSSELTANSVFNLVTLKSTVFLSLPRLSGRLENRERTGCNGTAPLPNNRENEGLGPGGGGGESSYTALWSPEQPRSCCDCRANRPGTGAFDGLPPSTEMHPPAETLRSSSSISGIKIRVNPAGGVALTL
ncbi:hypothetical protein AAFF_G00264120 [Aldrovandia affinis]|uniref:Uncharacterized protein n=1 Tax=Aldrovandia affinis TaxID=143900 RepID=A0AAD7SSX3_9TELE|nr:hypothetical protein AAFF_G00264120 [Aldrovandia affinis]